MNGARRVIVVLLLVIAAGYLGWRAWAPRPQDETVLSGYIEGEDLYLAAPIAGTIATMSVARGDRVTAGRNGVHRGRRAVARRARPGGGVGGRRPGAGGNRRGTAGAVARLVRRGGRAGGQRGARPGALSRRATRQSCQRGAAAGRYGDRQRRATPPASGTPRTATPRPRRRRSTPRRHSFSAQQAALADAQSKLDQLAPTRARRRRACRTCSSSRASGPRRTSRWSACCRTTR